MAQPRKNNNNNDGPHIKKSGATYTKIKDGNKSGYFHVSAWRITSEGLVKASAFPICDYDSSGNCQGVIEHVGKENGKTHVRYKVTLTQGITVTKVYTTMRLDTQKLVLRDLGLVISPNGTGTTKTGKRVKGFFGKNFS